MIDAMKTGLMKRVAAKARAHPERFARDEDGAMVIFGLYIFVLMLLAGGMAIDFMRHEHERSQVQYTLDRSILAAAALQQPLKPEDVVSDYFEKSGLKDYNLKVTPDSGLNYRTVRATAHTDVDSFFINMLGLPVMHADARGGAEERIQKVEISLVLDVSGSMGRNSRLENLKVAAKDFVDEVLSPQNQDLISISIIPYNMQVNAGGHILDEMVANNLAVTSEHNYSHCLDFNTSQFDSTGFSILEVYERTGHFNPFYRSWSDHPNDNITDIDPYTARFMCPTTDYSEVMLVSQDKVALKAKIDSLEYGGNTSIDIGVRWGATLLDPVAQPIVAASSDVPAVFKNRPRAYDDDDVLKVLVVMTDGVNTTQYTLDSDYASGPSNVWFDPDSTWLSVRLDAGQDDDEDNSGHRDDARFYNSDLYLWDNDGDGHDDDYRASDPHNYGDAKRLSWPELWNMVSTRYNAYYHHYARDWKASDYYDWRDRVTNKVDGSTKDSRLATACTAAKDKDMVVFTIGFEVPSSADSVMSNCATSESHYFSVEGNEISNAFNAIAKTIQRLKLTH